jgi:hypothetical protein
MIRKLLRALGLPVHKGWRRIGRHNFDRRCTGCGERQMKYSMGWPGHRVPEWWETTENGDSSCGNIPEMQPRMIFYTTAPRTENVK